MLLLHCLLPCLILLFLLPVLAALRVATVCKTCALLSSPTTSLRTYKPAGLPKDDLHRQTKEVNELTTAVTDDLTKLADKKKTEIEAV